MVSTRVFKSFQGKERTEPKSAQTSEFSSLTVRSSFLSSPLLDFYYKEYNHKMYQSLPFGANTPTIVTRAVA